MVHPAAGTHTVRGRAIVTDAAGTATVLEGEAQLPTDGGLLQFVASPTPLIEGTRSVRLEFDEPVGVAGLDATDPDTVFVLWMGQPSPGN